MTTTLARDGAVLTEAVEHLEAEAGRARIRYRGAEMAYLAARGTGEEDRFLAAMGAAGWTYQRATYYARYPNLAIVDGVWKRSSVTDGEEISTENEQGVRR